MKIPTDTVSQPLLKPLDADAAAAALDAGRIGLDHLPAATAPAEAELPRSEAAVADRDAGERLLATDVWNDATGSARLLPLSTAVDAAATDRSAALDQAVDTILAGLR